jgi:hypothetical protein
VTSSSVRDSSGNFLYAVRVQHDISARKEAEQALARRSEEQAALFRFSERLQYATSLPDVYDAGLDAILAALACERASILLFDDSLVMRFVGWRGLSDGTGRPSKAIRRGTEVNEIRGRSISRTLASPIFPMRSRKRLRANTSPRLLSFRS